ncbi:PilZ domain-containing protein [Butyrivibrio sp. MC2021]|uniref:PilZ domain-containing protein n=1 Tax=Butyrivibrio sp. MC2021 TaxID=1408306 RepID=UPI00047894A2|nr:PilZ domain-containing protein [Butyrivibrio sp. MC2021]
MNVKDISNGSEIKIHAYIGGHSIVLMTMAVFGVSAGLLVKPMEYFGKYMQFLEPSKIEVKNKRDGRVYKFMSTTITPVKTRYGNFHLIRSEDKLEPENTRKAERFGFAKMGVVSVGDNTLDLHNCIIHDISMRGLSLILDNDIKVKIGDRLNVSFRYGPMFHNYQISTVAVRYFNVQGKRAVGCSIANMNVDYITLVATKRNEKYTPLDQEPDITLNPEISQRQQIQEVEEDLASQLISERPSTGAKTITDENPFALDKLEHISDKTLRQKHKEERQAKQAKEIENLLDLRDI